MDGDLRYFLIGGKGCFKAVLTEWLVIVGLGVIVTFASSFFIGSVKNVYYQIYVIVCCCLAAVVGLGGFAFSSMTVEDRDCFKRSSLSKHAALFMRLFYLWSLPLFIIFVVVFFLIYQSAIENAVKVICLIPLTVAVETHVFFTALQIGSAISMKKFFCKKCGSFLEVSKSNHFSNRFTETKGGSAYPVNVKVGEIRCGDHTCDVYKEETGYTRIKEYDVRVSGYDYQLYCPQCGAQGKHGTYAERSSTLKN